MLIFLAAEYFGQFTLNGSTGLIAASLPPTHDLYRPVHNVFDACRSITWATLFWAPNGTRFMGPMPFHRAQKSLDFLGPTPLPLALVMDLHATKSLPYLTTGSSGA